MTDEECGEVYEVLSAYISNAGLQWVIEQVDEAIILGRLVDVPIKEQGSARTATYAIVQEATAPDALNKRSKPKYIQQIKDYTNCERLTMLLDALELAIVRSDALEQAVFKLLSPAQENIRIEFVPERRNDRGFILEKPETDRLAPLRTELFDKIERLKKEINAN
jgi:hypothetical protein